LPGTGTKWSAVDWTTFLTSSEGTQYGNKIGGVSDLQQFFEEVKKQHPTFADAIPANSVPTTGTAWRDNKVLWQNYLDKNSDGKIGGVTSLDAFLEWADTYYYFGWTDTMDWLD
jgi:hypothetical protein